MGRTNLLESVPLEGRNTMKMITVNDKWIEDGGKDVYTVYIDKSDGCDRELSATLAWYGEFLVFCGCQISIILLRQARSCKITLCQACFGLKSLHKLSLLRLDKLVSKLSLLRLGRLAWTSQACSDLTSLACSELTS